MKISVIIPSLYEVDGKYLELAVTSLRESTKDSPHDWDVIVVTNGGSHKPNLEHIKGISIPMYIRDQGQCKSVNAGAQVINRSTDYIMVSNADMYYAPGWDRNLRFEHLVFSPNLVEPVDNAGSAPPFVKADGGLTVEVFKKDVVDKLVYDSTINGPVEPETGFNLPFFVRKDVWETIGGYDVKYDPWGSNSDTDLQTKFHLAGIQTMRYKDVLVYHFSNKAGTFDGTHQEDWQRNWDYFTEKWGFNRDTIPTDVWKSLNILPVDEQTIKYDPAWKNRYADKTNT